MNDRETMELIVERLGGIPDAVRQTIVDHQWSTIPVYENEYMYLASLAAGVPMRLQPRTSNLFRVQAIVVTVPTGATGLVQLSDLVIPVSAGLTNITGVSLIVNQADTRCLTTAGSTGAASLWLSGEILPGPVGMRIT